jgi:hypothetical protein
VTLVVSDGWEQADPLMGAALVLYQLGIGAVVGLVVARIGESVLRRSALPSVGLYPIATVAIVRFAFAAAVGGDRLDRQGGERTDDQRVEGDALNAEHHLPVDDPGLVQPVDHQLHEHSAQHRQREERHVREELDGVGHRAWTADYRRAATGNRTVATFRAPSRTDVVGTSGDSDVTPVLIGGRRAWESRYGQTPPAR